MLWSVDSSTELVTRAAGIELDSSEVPSEPSMTSPLPTEPARRSAA